MPMIDPVWARHFAEEWIDAWNSHDLGRILSHYSDDFEMTSPLIIQRMQEPTGTLKGKDHVRDYWRIGLAATPPLEFRLMNVLVGVNSITLYYHTVSGRSAAEVLIVDEQGKVLKGMAHYGQ